ncbi:patatin [Salmonella enterica subsp. enterica]|nr:patatin [Salmonella enterica subsp. enterica]
MFRWGIIFLVIALIAAALGFGGLAGTAAGAAKIVFVVGIVLFLVSLFMGRKRPLAGICKDILLSSQSSGLAFTVLAVNVLRYLVSLEKNEKQEGRGGPANTGYARQYCAVIINTVPARPYGAGL